MGGTIARSLGLSPGFWFWAKHVAAMDELYDEYDPEDLDSGPDQVTNPELAAVWNGAHRGALIQVFEHVESDRDRLLKAAYAALEATIGVKGSPLRIRKRRSQNEWIVGAYAEPVRKKLPQGAIWLSIWLDTNGEDWNFYATIWAKGGGKTARLFAEVLSGVEITSQVETGAWDSGSALLSRVKLMSHVSDDGRSIDLDSALNAMKRDFERQTSSHLDRLIDRLREAK